MEEETSKDDIGSEKTGDTQNNVDGDYQEYEITGRNIKEVKSIPEMDLSVHVRIVASDLPKKNFLINILTNAIQGIKCNIKGMLYQSK